MIDDVLPEFLHMLSALLIIETETFYVEAFGFKC